MSKRKQCRARLAGRSGSHTIVRPDDPCDSWDPFEVLVLAMTASRAWSVLKTKLAGTAAASKPIPRKRAKVPAPV